MVNDKTAEESAIWLHEKFRKKRLRDKKQSELKPLKSPRPIKAMSSQMERRKMLEKCGKLPAKPVKSKKSEIDYY